MRSDILILGKGGDGKTTVADMLTRNYGLSFPNPSMWIAENIIMKSPFGSSYYRAKDSYIDRINSRATWAFYVDKYTRNNPSRVIESVCRNRDGYVGLRRINGVRDALTKDLFSVVLYVDNPHNEKADESIDFDYQGLFYEMSNFKQPLFHLKNEGNCIGRLERDVCHLFENKIRKYLE